MLHSYYTDVIVISGMTGVSLLVRQSHKSKCSLNTDGVIYELKRSSGQRSSSTVANPALPFELPHFNIFDTFLDNRAGSFPLWSHVSSDVLCFLQLRSQLP
jgi:hypothetical protein